MAHAAGCRSVICGIIIGRPAICRGAPCGIIVGRPAKRRSGNRGPAGPTRAEVNACGAGREKTMDETPATLGPKIRGVAATGIG